MKKTWKIVAIALLAIANVCPVMAGGILTNTNQNVAFLRNPARDGAIGIDGVYTNPAGVAFMKDGLHLSFNWQAAFQTRTIDSANPFFQYGIKNNGSVVKSYEGTSRAMFIPSLQAAYNKNKWSFQFNFAVTGGGGKCEFDEGLGSFEGATSSSALASALGSDTLWIWQNDNYQPAPETLAPGQGFAVKIGTLRPDTTLTGQRTDPISIHSGWNLIGSCAAPDQTNKFYMLLNNNYIKLSSPPNVSPLENWAVWYFCKLNNM